MSSNRNERRLFDVKDEAPLKARTTDGLQSADEITRRWPCGRPALRAYLPDNLPHLVHLHSTIVDVAVHAWGNIDGETCVPQQSYFIDGTRSVIEASPR